MRSWITHGPIQWDVEAPAVVVPGRHFPLALHIDAAATRAEGRVHACPGVPPGEYCFLSLDPFIYDPASFVGLPGRIEIDAHLDQAFGGPLESSLYAEFYLYDQDDTRHGPFVSPLTHTKIDLTNELRIRAYEQNTGRGTVTLTAIAGTQTSTQIWFNIGNNPVAGGGDFVVTATTDAGWLDTAPAGPLFRVAADTTGLDPRPTPYTAHVTLAAPGIPEPAVVDVALYVLPVIDVHWVTPPPAVVQPESTFPLAIYIDGPGVDEVELSLDGIAFAGVPYAPSGVVERAGTRGAACTGLFPFDDVIRGSYRVKLHDGPSFFLPKSPQAPLELPPVAVQLAPMTTTRVGVSPGAIFAETFVGATVEVAGFLVVQNCGTPQTWTASTNVPWLSLPTTSGSAVLNPSFHPPFARVEFDTAALRPTEAPYEGIITVNAPGIVGGSASIAVSLKIHAAPPYAIVPDAVVLAAVAGQSPLSTVVRGESHGKVAWRATTNVPWLILPVRAGADVNGTFPIGVDTTTLAPGLHLGMVTFHTPRAEPRETAVPVSIDVFPAAPDATQATTVVLTHEDRSAEPSTPPARRKVRGVPLRSATAPAR